MVQFRAHVGSLLQPSGHGGHGSPLTTLDENIPAFGERCEGQARTALLCEAWGPRHRIGALEKWVRECLRGRGPPTNEPLYYAALTADAPSAIAALVCRRHHR